jgi:hypothetical protein
MGFKLGATGDFSGVEWRWGRALVALVTLECWNVVETLRVLRPRSVTRRPHRGFERTLEGDSRTSPIIRRDPDGRAAVVGMSSKGLRRRATLIIARLV